MYRISKRAGDSRITTCGMIIPDGYTVVVEMNFDNQRQLENLKKFGYLVEQTAMAPGTYTPDGRRVDKYSVRDFMLKTGPLIYLDEPAELTRDEPKDEPNDELATLRAQLDEKGIKYRKDAGESALKKKLDTA